MPKGIFALVARSRAGKDTVCDIIRDYVSPDTVKVVQFSQPINICLEILGIPLSRANQQVFSTTIRESFGQDVLASVVRATVCRSTADWILINGVRRLTDAAMLQVLSRDIVLVHVDAPPTLRYKWAIAASEREGDVAKGWQEFIDEDKQECEQEIDAVARDCFLRISNTGSLEDLRARVRRMLDLVVQQ
jgi:hypothetical protein